MLRAAHTGRLPYGRRSALNNAIHECGSRTRCVGRRVSRFLVAGLTWFSPLNVPRSERAARCVSGRAQDGTSAGNDPSIPAKADAGPLWAQREHREFHVHALVPPYAVPVVFEARRIRRKVFDHVDWGDGARPPEMARRLGASDCRRRSVRTGDPIHHHFRQHFDIARVVIAITQIKIEHDLFDGARSRIRAIAVKDYRKRSNRRQVTIGGSRLVIGGMCLRDRPSLR